MSNSQSIWSRLKCAIGKFFYNEKYNLDSDLQQLFRSKDYAEALFLYQVMKRRHGAAVDERLQHLTLHESSGYAHRVKFVAHYATYLSELNEILGYPVHVSALNITDISLVDWFHIHDTIQKAHTSRMIQHSRQIPTDIPAAQVFENLTAITRSIQFYPSIFNNRPKHSPMLRILLAPLGPLALAAYWLWRKAGKVTKSSELGSALLWIIGFGLALGVATCGYTIAYLITHNPNFGLVALIGAFFTINPILLLGLGLFSSYNEETEYLKSDTSNWDTLTQSDSPFAQLMRAQLMALAKTFNEKNRLIDINLTHYTPHKAMQQFAGLAKNALIENDIDFKRNVKTFSTALTKYEAPITPFAVDKATIEQISHAFSHQQDRE